ncbi:hypothetical protein ACHAPT_008093, partial [Fusarium lateritium]
MATGNSINFMRLQGYPWMRGYWAVSASHGPDGFTPRIASLLTLEKLPLPDLTEVASIEIEGRRWVNGEDRSGLKRNRPPQDEQPPAGQL